MRRLPLLLLAVAVSCALVVDQLGQVLRPPVGFPPGPGLRERIVAGRWAASAVGLAAAVGALWSWARGRRRR